MAVNHLYSQHSYFYPVGNTSPIALTQDVDPHSEARILLLGCGDPRNILHTLHAEYWTHDSENSRPVQKLPAGRLLDIWCCDLEAAVIARNVLLFTLVADGHSSEVIWKIFYDFLISKSDLTLLQAQCRNLLAASATLELWRTSKYGRALFYCTRQSLQDVRVRWKQYADFDSGKAAVTSFKHDMHATFAEKGKGVVNVSTARSAGPTFLHAIKPASFHYEHVWQKGVSSMDPVLIANATCVNPTFRFSRSGDVFPLHYATHPLCAFPLAPAAADSPIVDDPASTKRSAQKLVQHAQAVFAQWCTTAKHCLSSGKLLVRFFCGDALSLCRSIGRLNGDVTDGQLERVSRYRPIDLQLSLEDCTRDSSRSKLLFDVIDTSNLVDHVGLINLLVIARPIMTACASSVLYTESLLPGKMAGFEALRVLMCGDPMAMSILLDMMPVGLIAKTSTISHANEVLNMITGSQQRHQRITWRIPSFFTSKSGRENTFYGLDVQADPKEIADALLISYKYMFFQENLNEAFSMPKTSLFVPAGSSVMNFAGVIFYCRETFALLLQAVRNRCQVKWTSVMERLLDGIEDDKTLSTGLLYFQDLCGQLASHKVYSVDAIASRQRLWQSQWSAIFPRWGPIPATVVVAFVVPRRSFHKLESLHKNSVGTPILQAELTDGTRVHNIFQSLQLVFGKVSLRKGDTAPQDRLDVAEDISGWDGKPDTVVSFNCPAWLLTTANLKVTLGVRPTPASVSLMSVLGVHMRLHEAKLHDTSHVFVLSQHPKIDSSELVPQALASPTKQKENSSASVSIALAGLQASVSAMTLRLDILEQKDRKALEVKTTAVQHEQAGISSLHVGFDEYHTVAAFPVPIDASRVKLRIARKSHYIEVICQPLYPQAPDSRLQSRLPILAEHSSLCLVNSHRLRLQGLPKVVLPLPQGSTWLNAHTSLTVSSAERKSVSGLSKANQSWDEAFAQVKAGIDGIISRYAGLGGRERSSAFCLYDPDECGGYCFFLVAGLRYDESAHTIVVDAFSMPLTSELMTKVGSTVNSMTLSGKVTSIITRGDKEVALWSYILPAFAERCRRSWTHTKKCEYKKIGRIPLSTVWGEDPLCSCGRGKDVSRMKDAGYGLENNGLADVWHIFSPHVTPIAISPLFTVGYIEDYESLLLNRYQNFSLAQPKENRMSFERYMSQSDDADAPRTAIANGSPGPAVRQGDKNLCAACGLAEGRSKCSACKAVHYCSAECQHKHWKTHKQQCRSSCGQKSS